MTHRYPVTAVVTERAEGCSPAWYAVRIQQLAWRKVQAALQAHGIEEYSPTYTLEVHWSDRTKSLERPLFAGYVFVRIDRDAVPAVLRLPGVVGILGGNFTPSPIPDAQIEAVRRVTESLLTQPECAYVVGDWVNVCKGPLAGLAGAVVKTRGAERVVVRVELLNRPVAVEMDAETVGKL
jgi:transcription antitermination factor NusG